MPLVPPWWVRPCVTDMKRLFLFNLYWILQSNYWVADPLIVVGHTSFNAKMDLAKFGVILEDRTPWILPTNCGMAKGTFKGTFKT